MGRMPGRLVWARRHDTGELLALELPALHWSFVGERGTPVGTGDTTC